MTHAILRPYLPEDRDALFDICVRTGHEGGDSRHLYEDPDLLPNIFAAPYVVLEPDLAFVVEDGGRAVGYILGTADTASFVARYRAEWLPGLVDRYPAPVQPHSPSTPAEMMTGLMHDPERMVLPELDAYPAHLHIDLLPSHQRYGYGRRLMETFLDALHARGVPVVHLSMLTSNTPARAFYDRVGFHEIAVPDPGPVTYLGRSTAATPPR
ncbi:MULTISPECIES: GNAT family N-acetyltransferase [unclassified Streptomyces]|uniref:GNAT family N-acetyltransferase n=1 Tax=unclassified Streptomyces TaxID=2593676 RepID=UPI000978F24F|nr:MULTISPECIES: GNAT family N-acetyltransferase [unclassified Streptomyces]ONI52194.1 putative acetyltransferase OgpAT [Streptomyces sp. IB2014 011-1]RDV50538.1 GNAT family N-acetyltransferase [Streptomyces sp. IB2014 011-12]